MADVRKDRRLIGGLSNILLMLLLGVVLFIIGIIIYMVFLKQLYQDHAELKYSAQPSYLEQTFEQHLEHQPRQATIIYQHLQDLFKDALPTFEPYNIFSYSKFTRASFTIANEQLSQQRLKDEILPRFIRYEWKIKTESDNHIALKHRDHGDCMILYPDNQYPNWSITCRKKQPSSLNTIPTKSE